MYKVYNTCHMRHRIYPLANLCWSVFYSIYTPLASIPPRTNPDLFHHSGATCVA